MLVCLKIQIPFSYFDINDINTEIKSHIRKVTHNKKEIAYFRKLHMEVLKIVKLVLTVPSY